ncbi:Oligo-1,6-glucosidase [Blastochloris viridis]|nr:alpha-amylase family glycosyl hydrolase [Blastochloris viridis]CUU42937.1 Oligo-1,6-glucosidase [Blastochloris viridis]
MAELAWWQTAVIYQIYPRSFQDSDGDGVGDLPGVIARLPHLAELGVGAIWLSPIYPSPMADFGYDVSDYTDIHPLFGTLDDFDALIAAAHARGLRVLLDFVPNHSSDRHPWFEDSRSSRDSAKRDWYIWRDPAPDGGPPTNWLSEFGGSAWTFEPGSGQYYYHAFLDAQPDLNWRNPAVRAAMADVLRFWLRRGVDGFRVDVIWHLIKDDLFRDNPPNPAADPARPPHERLVPLYTADRPEVHEVIAELRRVVDAFEDRVLIGEIYLPLERLVTYYGPDLSGVHLPFNFALLSAPWNAQRIAALVEDYEAMLPAGGWPNWVLGNHDKPRVASRVGPDQTRIAALLLLTLRGTPTIYYGEEIGMREVAIPPDRVRDPFEKNVPGIGVGRDGCRTPMPWSGEPFGGFSTVEPWLPLGPDVASCNVAAQRHDHASLLSFYRRLLALRRARPALSRGAYRLVAADGDLLAYLRLDGDERLLVALNLGPEPARLDLTALAAEGRVLLRTLSTPHGDTVRGVLELAGNDGALIELSAA